MKPGSQCFVICALILHFPFGLANPEQERGTLSPQISRLFEELSKHACHLKLVGFFNPISQQYNAEIEKYAFLLHQAPPQSSVTLKTAFGLDAWLEGKFSAVQQHKKN